MRPNELKTGLNFLMIASKIFNYLHRIVHPHQEPKNWSEQFGMENFPKIIGFDEVDGRAVFIEMIELASNECQLENRKAESQGIEDAILMRVENVTRKSAEFVEYTANQHWQKIYKIYLEDPQQGYREKIFRASVNDKNFELETKIARYADRLSSFDPVTTSHARLRSTIQESTPIIEASIGWQKFFKTAALLAFALPKRIVAYQEPLLPTEKSWGVRFEACRNHADTDYTVFDISFSDDSGEILVNDEPIDTNVLDVSDCNILVDKIIWKIRRVTPKYIPMRLKARKPR